MFNKHTSRAYPKNCFGVNIFPFFKLDRFATVHYFTICTQTDKLTKRVSKFTPKFLEMIVFQTTGVISKKYLFAICANCACSSS
jgi:hypothetical protein